MRVTAVTVAYGAEPWLERSVAAALASTDVVVDVVVVDNGCSDGATERLAHTRGVTVVRPGRNVGFAEGCNLGIAAATAELVALVNPDAIVDPPALGALARVAAGADVGIATASIRLADRPDRLNSAGNDIHFTGLSWSGAFDERAADHDEQRDVLAASGAAMLLRRQVWDELGGFDAAFFAYYEDADLSLRAWQRGYRVVFVPEAVVLHRYEFARRPEKMLLLERNRLLMVTGCFSRRLLATLLPILLVTEVGTLGMAVAQGWWRQKLSSWWWLVAHRREIARRRRSIQAARVRPDRDLLHLFATRLDPGNVALPPWLGPVDAILRAYWSAARRVV